MNVRSSTSLFVLSAALVAGGTWTLARAVNASDAAQKHAKHSIAQTDFTHAFERVADAIRPSVVSITSSREIDMPGTVQPFHGWFGLAPDQMRRDGRAPREHGMGSGVIIRADGYVLTNAHVVKGMSDLEVHLADGRAMPATIVGTDERTDLAVVKIDAKDLTPAEFADSEELKVGQWVAAFGAPFGLDQTMSCGIVSAKGRAGLHLADYEDYLQTDAAINPGNSGGPLVDLEGHVAGIDAAIATRSGGSQGIGFAIPSNLARSIADRLIDDGKVVRGWLGVGIQDVTSDLASSFHLDHARGVLIGQVTPDSPAEKADLAAGDVITALDGREVKSMNAFRNAIADRKPGTEVRLAVLRDGRPRDVSIVLATAPGEEIVQAKGDDARRDGGKGFGLQLADPNVAEGRGVAVSDDARGAIVVDVEPGSAAEAAGLQPGDEITEVERRAVNGVSDASAELKPLRSSGALLRVRRDDATVWVHLPPAR